MAIIFVVYDHGYELMSPLIPATLYHAFTFDGVNVFFVLSGFLIGNIFIKIIEQNDGLNKNVLINFWQRRWFRTLPNYFLILLVLASLRLIRHPEESLFNFIPYVFFCQNLLSPHPDFFPEAWSLSVEEWFYLILPFVFIPFSVKVKPKKAMLITIAFLFFIPLMLRIVKFSQLGIIDLSVYDKGFRKMTLLRLDSIALGTLGAYASHYLPELFYRNKIMMLSAGFLFLIIPKLMQLFNIGNLAYHYVFSFYPTSFAVLLMLPFFSDLKSIKNKRLSFVFYKISVISYSLYLVHLSLVQGFIRMIPINNSSSGIMISYFLYWLLSILLATFIYRYFETPVLKLRDKITKS